MPKYFLLILVIFSDQEASGQQRISLYVQTSASGLCGQVRRQDLSQATECPQQKMAPGLQPQELQPNSHQGQRASQRSSSTSWKVF